MIDPAEPRGKSEVDIRAADADARLEIKFAVQVFVVDGMARIARTEAGQGLETHVFAESRVVAGSHFAVEMPENDIGAEGSTAADGKCTAIRRDCPMVIGTVGKLRPVAIAADGHADLEFVALAHQGDIGPARHVNALARGPKEDWHKSPQEFRHFHKVKFRGKRRKWQACRFNGHNALFNG